MRASLKPAWAAAVTAPIRKLWPLKLEVSKPVDWSASCKRRTSNERDKEPSSKIKRGPGEGGRIDRYPRSAATGQSRLPVRPRYMWRPAPKISVLLLRRKTARYWGSVGESTLTS